MSKDLEIIKQIETKFGIKLDRLSQHFVMALSHHSYAIDENENIIGLKEILSIVVDEKNYFF